MANPIIVNVDLPSDNTDVLAGTALDPIPGPGILLCWLASTQRDGVLTIGGPNQQGGAFRVAPILRANGMPDINTDVPYTLAVMGGKLTVNYDEVTAGDAFATFMFIPG